MRVYLHFLLIIIENRLNVTLFVIKKRDICPILDYNREQMSVDAHLILTITIGRALALGLKAGLGFLKLLNDSKKGGANT